MFLSEQRTQLFLLSRQCAANRIAFSSALINLFPHEKKSIF